MLCADCKKKFPKWKKVTGGICLPCQQARRRRIQLAGGRRPAATEAWEKHKQDLEEQKYNKEKEAISAWLKH